MSASVLDLIGDTVTTAAPRRWGGPPAHRGPWAGCAAALAAVVLSMAFVWNASYASFTARTNPVEGSVSTARVMLTDDDAGVALFTVSDLRPGAAATRCVVVSSTSTVPTVVRLYATGRSNSTLADALTLVAEVGTGGNSAGGCTGFTVGGTLYSGKLGAFPTTYGSGLDNWSTTAPSAEETRTYRFTYSLPSTATSGAGSSASLALTWEAQTR
jgi:hypothetical protein